MKQYALIPHPPKRRRALPRILASVGWFFGLLLALCAVFVVVVDTLLVREQVRARLNLLLEETFRGVVRLDHIERIDLSGVVHADGRVLDPEGREVARLNGLRAEIALDSLLESLPGFVFDAGTPLQIVLSQVDCDELVVALLPDAVAGVSLAATFEDAYPSAVTPSAGADDSVGADSAAKVLLVGKVNVGLLHVSYEDASLASSGRPLAAEIAELQAYLRQGAAGFELAVERGRLSMAPWPLGLDGELQLSGRLYSPQSESEPLQGDVLLDGRVAGAGVSASASVMGEQLSVAAELREITAQLLNRLGVDAKFAADGALTFSAKGELPNLTFAAAVQNPAAQVQLQGSAALSPEFEAHVSARASRVDLSRVEPSLPGTSLDMEADAYVFGIDDGFVGTHWVHLWPSQVGEVPLPAVVLDGAFSAGSMGLALESNIDAREQGLQLDGMVLGRLPDSGLASVESSVRARLFDPLRLERWGLAARGWLTASGNWQQDGPTALRLEGQFARLGYRPWRARDVKLNAQWLAGRARPQLAAKVSLTTVLSGTPLKVDFDTSLGWGSRGVNGKAQLEAGRAGRVQLRLEDVEPLVAEDAAVPIRRGEVSVEGQLDLAATAALLQGQLPLERVKGIVDFSANAKLKPAQSEPRIEVLIDTHGLLFEPQRDQPAADGGASPPANPMPAAIEGLDLSARAVWEPQRSLEASVEVRDVKGTFVKVTSELKPPPGTLLASNRTWGAATRWPLRSEARISRRSVSDLPAALRGFVQPQIGASHPEVLVLSADASIDGTLAEPKLRFHAAVEGLQPSGKGTALAVALEGAASAQEGNLNADLRRGSAQHLAQASFAWKGDLRQARGSRRALQGDVEVECHDFPLELIPALADENIRGDLSGTFSLKQFGRAPAARVRLWSEELDVGDAKATKLVVAMDVQDERLSAELSMSSGQGEAVAWLHSPLEWGARWVPELRDALVAQLEVKHFELAALRPLLGHEVNEISGKLDGRMHAQVQAGRTRFDGDLTVSDGIVQVPAVGQRFSQLQAHLSVANDQLKLDRFSARGETGGLEAEGEARFSGLRVRSARLSAAIPKRRKIPITIEGAALGDAWGKVALQYDAPAVGGALLRISVPKFELFTPEIDSGQVQSLDGNEAVRVGTWNQDGKFTSLPLQPVDHDAEAASDDGVRADKDQPTRIEIDLGDVTVHRGDSATARLSGRLRVNAGELTGRIELTGGTIDVEGKRFEVDNGVVTFNGEDTSNPTIAATARWDSPTGHSVYAQYLGDVESGHIKLRADPPLTQDQIASLLLFGSPDGNFGSTQTDQASMAASVAGGTVAKGLNHALSRFTELDVSARVDSSTGSSRPELVVQVSSRVAAKLTRALGEPSAGEAPDRTFVTLELRLKRSWALSAVLGDRGASALDLIWRRRY